MSKVIISCATTGAMHTPTMSPWLPSTAETDAVINLTTGGSPTNSVADRLAAGAQFLPEMCSLNMG